MEEGTKMCATNNMDTETKKVNKDIAETEIALGRISGKWKCSILLDLVSGKKRYTELKNNLPAITQRMLTKQLRELEKDGLIIRKVYAEIPPKVVYSLSQYGISLKPILDTIKCWAKSKGNL